MSRGPSGYAFSLSTDSSYGTLFAVGSVWRAFGLSDSASCESILKPGNWLDVYGAGEATMGVPILLAYSSGVEG